VRQVFFSLSPCPLCPLCPLCEPCFLGTPHLSAACFLRFQFLPVPSVRTRSFAFNRGILSLYPPCELNLLFFKLGIFPLCPLRALCVLCAHPVSWERRTLVRHVFYVFSFSLCPLCAPDLLFLIQAFFLCTLRAR